MIRQPIQQKYRLILSVVSVLLLLGAYTMLSIRQHRENPDDKTIPTWRQLWDGTVQIIEKNPRSDERWIVVDAKATFYRFFLGLSIGVAGALIIGMLMGCFSVCESLFLPPLTIIALIPPTAALAVYFVLVGAETSMYVTMIAVGIGVTMARVVYLAVKEVPDELLYKAYTLGASTMEIIWNVLFRHILPQFIDSVRLHIPPAMIFLIAAEMVCGDVGFGYRIRLQSRLLNMDVVYPYLALLALSGFLMDMSFRLLSRWLCPWRQPEGR